jgi:hypothetical protein
MQFSGFLHDYKNVSWEDLPTAPFFQQVGVTKEDWDAYRAMDSTILRGAEFLDPVSVYKNGDRRQKEAAERIGAAQQEYIRRVVPDTNLRSRRAAGEAIDPNSAWGQIQRTMTSLLSFPIALHFTHLRNIEQMPRIRDKFVYSAAYFTFLTTAGAAITQAKALISGQQLYSMNFLENSAEQNLDFFGRSVLNGGSMGILGDVLMNWININNSPYAPGNPTTEFLKAVHKVSLDNLIDYANGDEIEGVKDTINLANQVIPKFWHTKLLFERQLMDSIEQEYDPAGYRRAKQFEREHEEGMWWGAGDEPEAIRLETIVGS